MPGCAFRWGRKISLEKWVPALRGEGRAGAGQVLPDLRTSRVLLVLSRTAREGKSLPELCTSALIPPGEHPNPGTLTLLPFRILIHIAGNLREPGEGKQCNSGGEAGGDTKSPGRIISSASHFSCFRTCLFWDRIIVEWTWGFKLSVLDVGNSN